MTVPSTTSRDQQAGNGVTTVFTVPFRILDQTHIRVLLTVAGVTTTQVLTTNYTVSGVGGASTTVTFLVAPPSGSLITFLRNVPFTQETDYVPNDPFPAESHERALDKLTMQVQQLNEAAGEGGRTIKIPAEVSGVSTTMEIPVGSTLWGWDSAGTAPRNYTLTEIATAVAYASKIFEVETGDGVTVDFTLSSDPGSLGNLEVSIDGVMQVNGADFSYSGTTLTFVTAPANGAVIFIRYDEALANQSAAASVAYNLGVVGAVDRSVQSRLSDAINAADFDVQNNGTDQSTKIQRAIDFLDGRGGGTLNFGAGIFRCKNVKGRNNVHLRGAGKLATVLKLPDGVDGGVIITDNPASLVTLDYFGIHDMTIDGNKSGSLGVTAASACSMNGVTNFVATNVRFQLATGYGLAMQGFPGGSDGEVQQNIYLENVDMASNGDGVGGPTFDGVDIKDCDRLTWIGGRVTDNIDDGVDIRGRSVTVTGVYSANNGNNGFAAGANNATPDNATTIRFIGCEARNNNVGFALDANTTPTEDLHASLSDCVSAGNTLYGLQLPTNDTTVIASATGCHIFENGSHGVLVSGASKACTLVGCDIRENVGSGVATSSGNVTVVGGALTLNTRYGFENTSTGTRSVVTGGCDIRDNTLGDVLQGTNERTIVTLDVKSIDLGSEDIIASAATIALPASGDYFEITGTTNITDITGRWRGRRVTLRFTGILTVTDGGTLILAGNFVTANSATISLISNGDNWYEVSRSTN